MPLRYPRLSKYQLILRLGSGGMADAYLAILSGPGDFSRLVVLKVLRPHEASDNPELVKMFEYEGRLAARLNHAHIVQSFEVGSDQGRHFIVMEYLEGQALNRIFARNSASSQPLTLEMQIFVLCQVLEGLEYAHALTDFDGKALEIVHRDVSPQNIFVTYSGHAKLLDFGIAKTVDSHRTRTGVLKGKAAYMSPEQALQSAVDHRSDLFSVGVVLWELLAEQRMFASQDSHQIFQRLTTGQLPSIRDVNPRVAPEFVSILERSLAVRPDERYPDAATFRRDLIAVLRGQLIEARAIGERVSEMFHGERQAVQDQIREALSPEENSSVQAERSLPLELVSDRAQPVEAPFPPNADESLSFVGTADLMTRDVTPQRGLPVYAEPAILSSAPVVDTITRVIPQRRRLRIGAALAMATSGILAAGFALQRWGGTARDTRVEVTALRGGGSSVTPAAAVGRQEAPDSAIPQSSARSADQGEMLPPPTTAVQPNLAGSANTNKRPVQTGPKSSSGVISRVPSRSSEIFWRRDDAVVQDSGVRKSKPR